MKFKPKYKCPSCKHHFKIAFRRKSFEYPGKVQCYKCENFEIDRQIIWSLALPLIHECGIDYFNNNFINNFCVMTIFGPIKISRENNEH